MSWRSLVKLRPVAQNDLKTCLWLLGVTFGLLLVIEYVMRLLLMLTETMTREFVGAQATVPPIRPIISRITRCVLIPISVGLLYVIIPRLRLCIVGSMRCSVLLMTLLTSLSAADRCTLLFLSPATVSRPLMAVPSYRVLE